VFSIAGSPPMEAIVVDTLTPSNTKQTQFRGQAQLRLADSQPLALIVKVRGKHNRLVYRFSSTGSAFPRFKGKITTIGEPESVQGIALTLATGRRVKVKDRNPASVTVAPSRTPASTTTTVSTTTTSELDTITTTTSASTVTTRSITTTTTSLSTSTTVTRD